MTRNDFVGSKTLIALALRRDRVKIPVWILSITLIIALILVSYGELSIQERTEIVEMASPNPSMRLLIAPTSAANSIQLGGFFLLRTSVIIAVLVALMSIQMVNRHTRNNEETGCGELLASTVVGRYASLTSALVVTVVTNIALAIFISVVFIANGLSSSGAFAAGVSFAGLGIVFAGFTAITAQLSESSRGSGGIAAIILASTFLINSVGNVMGIVNEESLGFESSWPVWLSPIGWVQQIHAFDENNWWVLGLFIITFIVLVNVAFILVNSRDVGRGMIPAKKGPANGANWLLSPLGLAWRLQRKTLIGWLIPIAVFGMIIGGASSEFGEVLEGIEGVQINVTAEIFLYVFLGVMAMFITIYVMQSFLRVLSEEKGGHLEPVLATAASRTQVVLSHIISTVAGSIALVLIAALAISLASDSSSSEVKDLVKAALLQGTAIFSITGCIIAAYGIWPNVSRILSGVIVVVGIIFGPFFGPMLNLSEGLQKLSPFSHVAVLPSNADTSNIVILLALGIVMTVIGVVQFNRRNLSL